MHLVRANIENPKFRLRVSHIHDDGDEVGLTVEEDLLGAWLKEIDDAYKTRDLGVEAHLLVTKVTENVFVRGTIRIPYSFVCSRCLAAREAQLDLDFNWNFLPKARFAERTDEEIELTEEDLDVSFYEGGHIDVLDVVREALMLEVLPFPTCPDECDTSELVYSAGTPPPEKTKDDIDPRWAPLQKALKDKT